jgi:hypothetical protein
LAKMNAYFCFHFISLKSLNQSPEAFGTLHT